ncbi:MAG: hypothetical protein K9N62_10490 [Verrucomicrobia bacterium]|jgi:O-methyltransferase involved in polyketide biosynthesis|nr:hypothetical protein [Verrucomicrobiota bacterium]
MKDDQASSTALTVQQGILFTAKNPALQSVVPHDMVEAAIQVLSCSQEGRDRLSQLESPVFRTLAPLMERLIAPGITLHYVIRKRYIEDAVHDAIQKNGVRQVISEGVMMYLLPEHVEQLFQSLRNLSGTGTRFVFTALPPKESDEDSSRFLLKLYLKFKSEPFHWLIESKKLPGFLLSQGYQFVDVTSTPLLKDKYLPKGFQGALHKGEYFAIADIAG